MIIFTSYLLQNAKCQISGLVYVILFDLTQQMQRDNRRECMMLGECALFTLFERTNHNIIDKSITASQFICNQGIKALKNIAVEYLKNKNKSQISEFTFLNNQKYQQETKQIITKKQLISEPSETSYTQTKKYPSLHIKSEAKFRESSFIPQKKKRLTEAEELRQSLKKLHIEEKDFDNQQNEQESQENTNNINLEYLQSKTLEELLQESNKKIQEKKGMTGKKQRLSVSSDQSYPLTEYSSNQSSNENEYEEELKSSKQLGKFIPFRSSIPSISQSSIGSSSYLPSKICNSPRKSKSAKKRIFIRNKKIPRWAQDLQQVKQEAYRQRNNPKEFDYKKIYGVCYVQKLDSNVIFNSEAVYHRGSSAKWNRYPYNQFIE